MTLEKCDTKTLTYRVLGEAVALGRVRAANIGGHIRTYTPAKSVEEKAAVRAIAQQAMAEQLWTMPSVDMPIKVEVTIKCQCPTSKSKWVQEAAQKGLIVPLSKPDVDNVLKLYLDAMNKVVFQDDKQVFQVIGSREYLSEQDIEQGFGPYTEVKVTGFYLNYGDIKARCAIPRPNAKGKSGRPRKKKDGDSDAGN